MEIAVKDYIWRDEKISFSIQSKEFNGITGPNREDIVDILYLKNNFKGKIVVNDKELKKEDINKYKRKINIIEEHWNFTYQINIYELMYYEIRRRQLIIRNPQKKIIDSLKIVGLDKSLLERSIKSLSSSEKKQIQLAIALLSNPDIVIIKEPFKNLDKKNEKKIMLLLQKIKDQYDKTIVFVSADSNMLYKYTNHLVVAKNNKILVEGTTDNIYQRVDFLKRNNIGIPQIVEFTYLAKKMKQIKLDYHKDIRDIIKDIYKHV